MLRERYGEFLGDIYRSREVYARSTDTDRTKTSTQMVLAGLYPPTPETSWSDSVHWIPIPVHYTIRAIDNLFFTRDCSRFLNANQNQSQEY